MLYDIAFLIFAVFYLPALIFKGKLHKDFAERFGIYESDKAKRLASARGAIWIQAVSVGETALCKSLIPLLRKKFPDRPIVLSTITKTGNELALKMFASEAIIMYFPLDFSFIARKVVGLIRPAVYVMIETEIWPNILKALSERSVPGVLINGRISDKSFGKYKLAKPFLRKTLERISVFCMQSAQDAERIMYLGAPSSKIRITGNMKFDADVAVNENSVRELSESLDLKPDEDLFVFGSTHRGEEEIALDAFKALSEEFPRLKLLIAPRHVERAGEVADLVKKYGFEPIKLSELSTINYQLSTKSVFILDTIGRLKDAYVISALVFIGGSLVRHGGQNPLEPAIFEKPIIFGPHMFNFKSIAGALIAREGALQVHCERDLVKTASILLKNRDEAARIGVNAKKTVLENRGATEENLKTIAELIEGNNQLPISNNQTMTNNQIQITKPTV